MSFRKLPFLFTLFVAFFTIEVPAQGLFKLDSANLGSIIQKPLYDSLQAELKGNEKAIAAFNLKFEEYLNFETQKAKILTEGFDKLEMDWFDQKQKQNTFLSEHKSTFSPWFLKAFKHEIEATYWQYIYAYPILRANNKIDLKKVSALPLIASKDFDLSKVILQSSIFSQTMSNLCQYYISYQNSKARNFDKYANPNQAAFDKCELSFKLLDRIKADYCVANILHANNRFLTFATAKSIISRIDNRAIQVMFTGEFLARIQLNEEQMLQKMEEEKKKKDLGFELDDLKGAKFGLEKYAGKVVYVDFWASWCGPCRAEFPHSISMKQSLSTEEKKNIVFLNISIDDDLGAWKNAVTMLGLQDFEHGISTGGWSSKVVQKYMIRSIPRYMILNKEGKVVKNNANRPSNPETLEELKMLAR